LAEAHPTEGPPHPIVTVANEAAQLSHILELQIENLGSPASLDNAFSASTRKALRRCAAFPATETMDGRPVVDSGSYLKAVLGAGEYEHKTGSGGQGRTEIHPLEVEIRPVARPAGAEPQQVRLTMPEVETLRRLGPILGKTPRAVKRFVNLYRLVRGLRRGPDLDDFLEKGALRPYAAYQFWLAVAVGLPLHQARRLRTIVGQLNTPASTAGLLLEPLGAVLDLKPDPALQTPSRRTGTSWRPSGRPYRKPHGVRFGMR
jgi:hypothetical protein